MTMIQGSNKSLLLLLLYFQYMIFNSGRYPFQITCFYSRLEGIPSRLEWIHSGHVPEFGYENSPQNSGVKFATLP